MPRDRSDEDVTEAIDRMVRALGRRIATADPDALRYLILIEESVAEAWSDSVAGLRESGFSDGQIGRELGVTRQAVAQRWPWRRRVRGRQAQGYR